MWPINYVPVDIGRRVFGYFDWRTGKFSQNFFQKIFFSFFQKKNIFRAGFTIYFSILPETHHGGSPGRLQMISAGTKLLGHTVFQYGLSLIYSYFSRNIIEIIEETYIRVPSKSSQITKIVQKIKDQFHSQFFRISLKTSDCTYVNFTMQIKLPAKLDSFSH